MGGLRVVIGLVGLGFIQAQQRADICWAGLRLTLGGLGGRLELICVKCAAGLAVA